jgi:Tfp pilus assembly protein PilN
MPNVNLIAVRRAEKKRLERNARRLLLGLAAEAGVLVLLTSYVGARQLALRGALAEANGQLLKLQPTLDRIGQIEKDTAVLRPKLDTLQFAKADTLRWRAMLQIVSQSVPGNAWLSRITSVQNEDNTTITIAGTAGSQTLVGETMTRLGSFPVFDKVELAFTQLSTTPRDPVQRVSFEIGASLKSTRPAPDAAKGGDAAAGGSEKQANKGGRDGEPSA